MTRTGQAGGVDEHLGTLSARLMGLPGWDRFEPVAGGGGHACLAWRGDRGFVVKPYPSDPGRGARERAALLVLGGAAGTPRLLAESEDPPFVVMDHLEGVGSLADVLLGVNAQRAVEALHQWAAALAELHAHSTPETCDAFAAALVARAPGLEPRSLTDDFAVAAHRYTEVLGQLGLPPHPQAIDDLRTFPSRLSDPCQEVLTPADTCPDNNVLAPGGLHLIDFEHAQLRHRAWDVAYLLAPWPSCWCSWLLPEEAARTAVDTYRRAAGAAVADAAFVDDLELATLGWRVMTPAWFVAGALADDDRSSAVPRPSRRAFVLHRLAAAAGSSAAPALAAMAADLHASLRERWGDVRLDLAPAFRGTSTSGPTSRDGA